MEKKITFISTPELCARQIKIIAQEYHDGEININTYFKKMRKLGKMAQEWANSFDK